MIEKIIAGVGGGVVAIGVILLFLSTNSASTASTEMPPMNVDETGEFTEEVVEQVSSGEGFTSTYQCADDQTLETSYDLGSNRLTVVFGDGESYELSQVVMADSARYALSDNSVIFTEDRGEAQLQVDGETRLTNCVSVEN